MSSLKFGSNLFSLNAQRRFGDVSAQLRQSFERLSSGLRINHASDDAAGLAISESLKADVRVVNQGIRNLNDGVSLLSIADATLESLGNITIRLKELAEQAANGVYGVKQRKALDAEAQALSKEYLRIAQSTGFNGLQLFNGNLGDLRLQGGFGSDGGITAGLGGAIGDGTLLPYTTIAAQDLSEITSGDFNNDGIIDLAGIDATADVARIFLGSGSGQFASGVSYTIAGGSNGQFIIGRDFNNDGILDIATSAGTDLGILLGNGDGTFTASRSYASTGYLDGAVADFNNDGNLDIVMGSSANDVSVLLGRGDGTFGAELLLVSGDTPGNIVTGDFNNDGLADFATADEDDSSVSVFLGNGNGTFRARISSTATGPRDIIAADFNGDGKLDYASAPKGIGGSIRVAFGLGNGSFGASVNYTSYIGDTKFQAADFNGDGILDLVGTGTGSDSLSVLLGNANGTFKAAVSYSTNTNPATLLTQDVNADGVVDVVAVSSTSDTISISLGKGVDGVGPLLPFSLLSRADALQSFSTFDNKLTQLVSQRGKVGAMQSRISSGLTTLQVSSENLASAYGRIKDVDVAEESSRLVRLRILQQAASAVLAQANQQPALALRLLG